MPTATCEGCGREVEYDAETLARRSSCMYCGKPLSIADEMVEAVKQASIPPPPAAPSEPPQPRSSADQPADSPAERRRRLQERNRLNLPTATRDKPKRGPVLKLVLIGGAVAAVLLGIYLLCYFRAISKQQDFMAATMGLQDHLVGLRARHGKDFDPELIEEWVAETAEGAGVEVLPNTIALTVEVITNQAQLEKTSGYRASRDAMPGGGLRDPAEWLIGFEGRFHTEYGLYGRDFNHEQFTSFPYSN